MIVIVRQTYVMFMRTLCSHSTNIRTTAAHMIWKLHFTTLQLHTTLSSIGIYNITMSASNRVQTVVIGAGVIGLACARRLAEKGHEVLILERTASIGSGK